MYKFVATYDDKRAVALLSGLYTKQRFALWLPACELAIGEDGVGYHLQLCSVSFFTHESIPDPLRIDPVVLEDHLVGGMDFDSIEEYGALKAAIATVADERFRASAIFSEEPIFDGGNVSAEMHFDLTYGDPFVADLLEEIAAHFIP